MADIKIPSRVTELRVPVINAAQLDMARRLQKLSYASILDPIDLFDEHGRLRRILDTPEHARRAIAGYDVDSDTFVTKLKFVDKRGRSWIIRSWRAISQVKTTISPQRSRSRN